MRAINFFIYFSFFLISCRGQIQDDRFKKLSDSLDYVQPKALSVYKNKAKAYNIKIKEQYHFDKLQEAILKAINDGRKNIIVEIEKGIYFYQENHIYLKDAFPDVSITIKGKKAVLIAAGNNYRKRDEYKNEFNHATTFVDVQRLQTFDSWSDAIYADSLIEVVDEVNQLCRIPYSVFQPVNNEDFSNVYVSITQWYQNKTYKVTNINQRGIYFIADDLKYIKQFGREGWSVNYDYIYGKQNPRFRLCNYSGGNESVHVSNGYIDGHFDTIHECQASRFLMLDHIHFSSFSIRGLRFIGNKGGSELMRIRYSTKGMVHISDCTFESIWGCVVYADGSQNIEFVKNKILDCYDYGVRAANGCSNIRITNNHFENSGLNMKNTFCITSAAEDYYIAHNTFKNFGYGAIGVGVWHGSEKKYVSSGIIEHNEMWYTSDYFLNKEKHTIMDSGAIYLWTQNDDAIIRYNYIHDYTGMEQNRGVFCDDGASNFRIYGNIVLNTPNSYSIDSRRSEDLHEWFTNNANNFIANNVVDGAVRFQGYGDEERRCVKGANYVIRGENTLINKFDNLEENRQDIEIEKPSLKMVRSKYIKNFKIRNQYKKND